MPILLRIWAKQLPPRLYESRLMSIYNRSVSESATKTGSTIFLTSFVSEDADIITVPGE